MGQEVHMSASQATGSSIYTSNEVVEGLLRERILAVEQELDADLIAYRGPITYGVDDLIRDATEELNPKRDRLAMVLETDGGLIEVAERIAKVFRHHYRYVQFIIPNAAMSAGTVLVMSGDAIWMDYYSVLGPIDPQVPRAGSNTWVPALGYLEKYDRLIRKSAQGKLTSAELTFLVEKFDPAELFRYEQERDLSVTLLKEWLVNYKFKNWNETETKKKKVTPQMREKRAGEIAAALSKPSMWHTHSRGISMHTLRDKLRLKIDDFGEHAALNAALKAYNKLLTDYLARLRQNLVVHTREKYEAMQMGEI